MCIFKVRSKKALLCHDIITSSMARSCQPMLCDLKMSGSGDFVSNHVLDVTFMSNISLLSAYIKDKFTLIPSNKEIIEKEDMPIVSVMYLHLMDMYIFCSHVLFYNYDVLDNRETFSYSMTISTRVVLIFITLGPEARGGWKQNFIISNQWQCDCFYRTFSD